MAVVCSSVLELEIVLRLRTQVEQALENSHTQLSHSFNKARPHIEAALNHCGNTHSPEHVFSMLQAGVAKLYVGESAAVVTQDLTMPNGVQLHFWLAAGDLEELRRMETKITDAARKRGIKRVSLIGRSGWLKALPGYQDAGRILVKEIS